jgi:hypothetical protein
MLEQKEVFSYSKYNKRCNYPCSLIANKKAMQNVRLFLVFTLRTKVAALGNL